MRLTPFFSGLSLIAAVMSFTALAKAAPSDKLLESYKTIQSALATDDLIQARNSAEALLKEEAKSLSAKTTESAHSLAVSKDLKSAREAFGALSEGIVSQLKESPKLQEKWKLFQCPMAKGYQYWVQPETVQTVMNPYMGKSMQQCGMKRPWG